MTSELLITILAVLVPIMSISSFVIGFNMNADRKIRIIKKKEKTVETEEEKLLERIENAHV